jgi:hypothetical protein
MEAKGIAAIDADNYDFCPTAYGEPDRNSIPPDGAQFYRNWGNPVDSAVKAKTTKVVGQLI